MPIATAPILKHEAHEAIAGGTIEFVGGNHISTYGAPRSRRQLGQVVVAYTGAIAPRRSRRLV